MSILDLFINSPHRIHEFISMLELITTLRSLNPVGLRELTLNAC
jgi:hypothetical protein